MSVEELIEKSTITFPRGITVGEFEQYLKQAANHHNYRISYTIEEHKGIGNILDPNDFPEETLGVKVEGTVYGGNATQATFHTEEDSATRIATIRFFTIPGYDLGEHNKEDIKIWDNFRNEAHLYFLNNNNT